MEARAAALGVFLEFASRGVAATWSRRFVARTIFLAAHMITRFVIRGLDNVSRWANIVVKKEFLEDLNGLFVFIFTGFEEFDSHGSYQNEERFFEFPSHGSPDGCLMWGWRAQDHLIV